MEYKYNNNICKNSMIKIIDTLSVAVWKQQTTEEMRQILLKNVPNYEDYLHSYNVKKFKRSNNDLKMHGLPMRRNIVNDKLMYSFVEMIYAFTVVIKSKEKEEKVI